MHHPSSRSAQRQTRHFLTRYATTPNTCCLTFCLRRKSRCTPCDLECMTEFSRSQTTGCVELFLLACYILITRVYERILPCRTMYCITMYMYVTQNAVFNCEINSILTYLLTYLTFIDKSRMHAAWIKTIVYTYKIIQISQESRNTHVSIAQTNGRPSVS